jgi:hypothetical protein
MAALAKTRGAMACCMMEGRCDCGHSDASFARCTGQDTATFAAVALAMPPSAAGRLEPTSSGRLAATSADDAASLFDSVPPTPPPRAATL